MTEHNNPDTLGDRLRRARAVRGLTQADVGKEFGISGRSVSQWETNVTRPNAEKLKHLAEVLDVSLDWLYGHTDELATVRREKRRHGPMSKVEREREIKAFSEDGGLAIARISEIHSSFASPEKLRDLHDIITSRNKWAMPLEVLQKLEIENHEQILINRVVQDAMAPTIQPGDYALISTAKRALEIVGTRGIYVVNDFSAVMMRRVEPIIHEGQRFLTLIADNSQIASRLVSPAHCLILGRVVGTVGFFR